MKLKLRLGFLHSCVRRSSSAGNRVTVVEVGPRDGLQNEKTFIPTAVKIDFIDRLSQAGLPRIEVTSFVSPKWVPQLGDAAEVASGIRRRPGTIYSCLTPNPKGFEAARIAKLDEVAIFGAASEAFSQRNINCSIAASLERFSKVTELAKQSQLPVRAYVSCVAGCPYEGAVAPGKVAEVAAALLKLGCYEVSLGDTIGAGTPEIVDAMLKAMLEEAEAKQLAIHCHDTHGRALDNIDVALERGVRIVDAATGGLGGCPYGGSGAKGNVATEAVLARLHELGFATGVDEEAVQEAGRFIRTQMQNLQS